MDLNFFDMFDMANAAPPVTTKKKAEKKAKAEKKPSATSKMSFGLPVTVYGNCFSPCTITKAELGLDEDKVTDIVLIKYLADNYPYILTNAQLTSTSDGKDAILYYSRSFEDIKYTRETKLFFGEQSIDGSAFLGNEAEVTVKGKVFCEFVAEHIGYDAGNIQYTYDKQKNAIQVFLSGISSTQKASTYAKVSILGTGEIVEVGTSPEQSKDDSQQESLNLELDSAFNPFSDTLAADLGSPVTHADSEEDNDLGNESDFGTEDENEGEDEDESEGEASTKSTEKNKHISVGDIRKAVSDKYPWFKEHTDLYYNKEDDTYVAFLSGTPQSCGSSGSKPKEELFPVEGYTLSITFERFVLDKSDFGGKANVTKKDICRFLLNKDYPEFEDNRTNILKDEKRKLLIAQVQGSRKGAEFATPDEIQVLLNKESSFLRDTKIDGEVYRCQKTPVGVFLSSKQTPGKGSFHMTLPKIPMALLYEISAFFRTECINAASENRQANEMFFQVFYKISERRYYTYMPSQYQTHVSVNVERNLEFESDEDYILVMDCHSHNTMPAFFSSIDDADEKGTRLYLVAGNYNGLKTAEFKLRFGNGGYFADVVPSDVFDKCTFGYELDYPMEGIYTKLCPSHLHPLSMKSNISKSIVPLNNNLVGLKDILLDDSQCSMRFDMPCQANEFFRNGC